MIQGFPIIVVLEEVQRVRSEGTGASITQGWTNKGMSSLS